MSGLVDTALKIQNFKDPERSREAAIKRIKYHWN